MITAKQTVLGAATVFFAGMAAWNAAQLIDVEPTGTTGPAIRGVQYEQLREAFCEVER